MDDRADGEAQHGPAGWPTGGSAGEVDSAPVRPPAQAVLDTIGRARPVTLGNAAVRSGAVVRVTGRAAPGPGGPLRAPLSGAECVWYRSVVFRHERETHQRESRRMLPLHPMATSDAPSYNGLHSPGLSRQQVADDRSSSAPFALDDGTGALLVHPTGSDIDSNVFAINEVVVVDDPSRDQNVLRFGGGPFDHQELHVEWIIPVGAPLFAVGTVAASGPTPALVPSGQDVVLVSTKPEQQILDRSRAAVDPSAVHLPFHGGPSMYRYLGAVITVALAVAITLVVLFVVPH